MIDQPVTWHDIERELETYVYPAQDQDVLIFGGGLQGINAAPELAKELSIVAFCDNDWQKQGTTISDLPCIAPSEISRFENPFILVSTIKYYRAVSQQLAACGLPFCTVDAYVTHKYFDCFFQVYQMLDERSRGIYAGMLLSRISGNQERIADLCEGQQYFALPQFRFCDIQEVFVDCGAYTGENVQTFLNNQVGIFQKIYAFEANPEALAAMRRRLAYEKDVWLFKEEQIVCERNFVSDKDGVRIPFHITQDNPTNSFIQENAGDVKWVEAVSLDRYFERRGEEIITFLKSDIEGAEWDMLHGAANIIRRSKPKAAISIYHSIYDFFRIPLYLKELVPEYRFAVRQHWNSYDETVLYAFLPE
ncbi:MAG: FkbM family methyltransferase [Oscillospiraceae bacterium]|nr:FkbM family methyltransferase [Oscillospiraceae bacterium]